MQGPDELGGEAAVRDQAVRRGDDESDGLSGRGPVVCALPGAAKQWRCDIEDAVRAEDRGERLNERARVQERDGDQRLSDGYSFRQRP